MNERREREYVDRLVGYLNVYRNILTINIDNIKTRRLTKLRVNLRKSGSLLIMGKNSLIRTALEKFQKEFVKSCKEVSLLITHIKGDVGVVFFNETFNEVLSKVEEIMERKFAREGRICSNDIWVEKGPTHLEPTRTAYFASLNISTKIMRGRIEILSKTRILKQGEVIPPSVCAMCRNLRMKPFVHKIKPEKVMLEGFVCDVEDIRENSREEILLRYLIESIRNVAAVSIELNMVNETSIPHMINDVVEDVVAISLGVGLENMLEEMKIDLFGDKV